MTTDEPLHPLFPAILAQLIKGVLYADRHHQYWLPLLQLQAAVRDYFNLIGLALYIDEAEGYAFLKQQESTTEEPTEVPLPRLIARRSLTFPVSLLLVLLRKKLVEEDARGEASRVILSREQIIDLVTLFMPKQKNEARLNDQINTAINRVIEYGFLRKLTEGEKDKLEIKRILKAFVDTQWLDDFQQQLNAYKQQIDDKGQL